jgi:hypothetical protein
MKKLDFNALGVQEMEVLEMLQTDGGTEIGYFIGYWTTELFKAVDNAIESVMEEVIDART